jgi:hypothetical protein
LTRLVSKTNKNPLLLYFTPLSGAVKLTMRATCGGFGVEPSVAFDGGSAGGTPGAFFKNEGGVSELTAGPRENGEGFGSFGSDGVVWGVGNPDGLAAKFGAAGLIASITFGACVIGAEVFISAGCGATGFMAGAADTPREL